ncbi:MAG TPA: hypothetical protein VGB74_05090 [Actinoplanes sp.]
MANRTSTPLGRTTAVELVRELMIRPIDDDGRPQPARHPVLVLEGPAGAGITTVFEWVADNVNERVPFVLIDFERHRRAGVVEVLAAVAGSFGHRAGRYSAFRFPRFALGLLAADPDPQAATIGRRRSHADLHAVIRHTAGRTAVRTTAVDLSRPGVRLIQRAQRAADALPVNLERARAWFGDQDEGLRVDPGEQLEALHDLASAGGRDATDQVARILCGAFLADLRDNFANRRLADEWSMNCLLLADNADLPAAQHFLRTVVDRRRQQFEITKQIDPLTMVAGSGGDLLAQVSGDEQAALDPSDLSYAEFVQHSRAGHPLWLAYRLPAFSDAEVQSLVTSSAPRVPRQRQLSSMIRGLTRGHPKAVRSALDVVVQQTRSLKPAVLADVRFQPLDLLTAPATDATDPSVSTVEDQLRRGLLGAAPADSVRDLITLSAARSRQHGHRLAETLKLAAAGIPRSVELALWTGDGRPSMARWLLLRQLAGRGDDHALSWSAVHRELQRISQQDGSEEDEFYYALADRDIATVVRHLAQRLREESAGTWLDALTSVTVAPNPTARRGPAFEQLNAEADRAGSADRAVARIVAGRWILADPLTGPDRKSVHLDLAASFNAIVTAALSDGGRFHTEASQHHREAEEWD